MKEAVRRWVKPYAKFITAAIGLAAVFLAPEHVEYIVGILTAIGVYTVPNTPVEA